MLPQTAVNWLSSAEVGAKFGVEQYQNQPNAKLKILLNKQGQWHQGLNPRTQS